MRNEGEYKVEQVGEKWQVFFCPAGYLGEVKYPVDQSDEYPGGRQYPSRQNAYARRKQLQDRLSLLEQYFYDLHVEITMENRDFCRPVVRALSQLVNARSIIVHDPLYDAKRSRLRYITCALFVRKDEDASDPRIKPWRKQPPTEQEFREFLAPIRSMLGIVSMEIGYQAFPIPTQGGAAAKDQLVIYARRIAQYSGYSDLVDGLQPLERLQSKYQAEIDELKEALAHKSRLHAFHEAADVAYYAACVDEQAGGNKYADAIRECEHLMRVHNLKVSSSQIEQAALAKYEYRASAPDTKNEAQELRLINNAIGQEEYE